ncbi:hypothetical protein AB0M43_23665 [Longispora sp. NPDC051575]|uniref:hypothetical protein n=1 Tax=Longispora sp. NPDC051575 TaxID=3154943 RepID=UPI00342FCC36
MTGDVLSAAEAARLRQCEQVIAAGLDTFVEVGQALAVVRDLRLYRSEHQSFREYCQERWRLSRSYADRLISAADVVGVLAEVTPSGTEPAPVPVSEAQARPLARLLPSPGTDPVAREAGKENVRQTWTQAVSTAPRTSSGAPRVTAEHVAAVIAERSPSALEDRAPPSRRRRPLTDEFAEGVFAHGRAVTRLARLLVDDRWPSTKPRLPAGVVRDLARQRDEITTILTDLSHPDPNPLEKD